MPQVELYDTTLRDGAQHEGISLSVSDKLAITDKLDQLGVNYIEGGWPGSNPKDVEYFAQVQNLNLVNATLVAFGSTRRAAAVVGHDPNIISLLNSEAPVVTLVGKSSDLHVTKVLETTLEENLAMIADSVAYLTSRGRRVFFDAEHFFDGFKSNPDYALQVVRIAESAGAEYVILCDTNGGTLPHEIAEIVSVIRRDTGVALGIHAHNDTGMAVAGTLAAVRAGVIQVQGTVNGYGERCGNANLISVIAALKLKLGIDCVTAEQLKSLTHVSRSVAELANMPLVASQPYVGVSAFAHKGGLHASAVVKIEESYQHIQPERVGNTKRVLVSELSGRGNILYKVKELNLDVQLNQRQAAELAEQVKLQESKGLQYEGAEASFELLARRILPSYQSPFTLVDYRVVVEKCSPGAKSFDLDTQAMVKVKIDEKILQTVADGNGPVNALDDALRKAVLQSYPSLASVRLVDYKVRVVDQGAGTGSIVRVIIESTDGNNTWYTVGASANVIEASWFALSDSLEYWLLRQASG
jgi:2-isopropylmalate synthase